jgi:ribA/ribD-fused uncharacterized protein
MSRRVYLKSETIAFRKTNLPFGGLSNMAPGFPILINGYSIRTSEALYQACRFPDFPMIQKQIINERSPMSAKGISKREIQNTRDDWDLIRFKVMRWCLEVKLFQNWEKFSLLLESTGNKYIVESTPTDKVWGAVLKGDSYEGVNALGRLLMELREKYIIEKKNPIYIHPPEIPDFKISNELPLPINIKKL